jgi:uncharacterized protein (TIGR02118 family)
MTLYNKRPDMSYDEFRYEVMDVHVPMVVKLPGLKRYQQSFNINWPPTEDGLPYDGIAELWFETAEAHQAAMSQAQEPLAHAAEILDLDTLRSMVVEEHPIPLKDSPNPDISQLVRFLFFYNKRDDLTYDEVKRHLLEVHVPIVTQYPGLKHYQQSFNVDVPHVGNKPGYDGIAELWFETPEAFQHVTTTTLWEEGIKDAALILNMDRLHTFVARVHPISLPTPVSR